MYIIVIIENERDWWKLDKVRGNFVVLCIPSYSRYFDTWVIELWNNRGGKSVQYSGILNTKYDNRIFSSSDPARKENRRVFPMKIWNFWEIALYRTRLIPNERSIIRYMPERVLIRLIRSLVSLNSLTRHISLEARIARNEGDRSRHRSWFSEAVVWQRYQSSVFENWPWHKTNFRCQKHARKFDALLTRLKPMRTRRWMRCVRKVRTEISGLRYDCSVIPSSSHRVEINTLEQRFSLEFCRLFVVRSRRA